MTASKHLSARLSGLLLLLGFVGGVLWMRAPTERWLPWALAPVLGLTLGSIVLQARSRAVELRVLELLRQSEERLRLLVESAKDQATVMLDVHGQVISWNEGARRICGYEQAEILGESYAAFFVEEDVARQLPEKLLRVAARRGNLEIEGWTLRKNGERFWANTLLWAIRGERGALRGFAALTRDMSERRRAEEERERLLTEVGEAVRMRDEFLSIASHELKTPLTSLQLVLEQIQRSVRGSQADAAMARRVQLALRQTRRLAQLTNELLDVARIAQGKLSLHREEFDLGRVVGEVVHHVAEEAAKAGCVLRFEVEEPLIGRWDRLRVEQVVLNLLSNALKYGAGQPVEVSLFAQGKVAHLSVRDHGIGVEPQAQERIFGKFERAVSSRHFGGLGLGLFISRQIIEAHEGRIYVESCPERGATFHVELPLPHALTESPQPATELGASRGPAAA